MSTPHSVRIAVDARSALCAEPRGEGKSLQRLYWEIAKARPEWQILLYGQGRAIPAALRKWPRSVSAHWFDPRGSRWDAWQNLGIPMQNVRRRPSLTHCTSSAWPLLLRGRGVMTVHDVIPAIYEQDQSPRSRELFCRDLKRGLERAAHVIAVSENTKRDLQKLFSVDPEKISVIHWGVDAPLAQTKKSESELQQLHRLAGDGEYAFMLGGGAWRKNTETVVRAFAASRCARSALRFVIGGVGTGPARERIRTEISRLDMNDRIVLLPYVSEPELELLYRGAQMFIYASLYEGFGLPALEAMRFGVPVIASSTSSVPEVVGEAAELVDPQDPGEISAAIDKLHYDLKRRHELGTASLERVQRFPWEDTAHKTISVFERVLAGSNRASGI